MNIKIDKPCKENWDQMKIGLISRHCEKCEKPVMDFTTMNRAEIITYLLSNREEKVCGRMRSSQFDFHHDDIPILIEALGKKGGNTSFLILALVCMSLVSCGSDNSSIKTPDPIANSRSVSVQSTIGLEKDTLNSDLKTLTPPACVKSIIKNPAPLDPKPILMGKVIGPEPPVAGGILISEPPVAGGILIPEPPVPQSEDEVLTFAEKMPEYPGRIPEMFKFIQSNMVYPEIEKEKGLEGAVYIRFVVTKEGKVMKPEVLRGVSGSKSIDKEALRVVNMMPDWIPGENGGKKVNVYFTIPIKFKLN